ncbi:MAG: agmatine deiminase family protein [Pseudomonadota bacterium]|nr:agmatine deiminase family protein [Pseudomonadota bacterium]
MRRPRLVHPSRRALLGGLFASAGTLVGCGPTATVPLAPARRWRLPAEWEPHERCVMVFPTAQNWAGCWDGRCDWLDLARAEWAAVANAVAAFEPVLLFANEGEGALARALVSADIEVVEVPVNDAWARDIGPLVQVDDLGGRRVAGVRFNSWGEKFSPYDDDAAFAARVADRFDLRYLTHDLVLEGGAISVDGEGTLLTTERCLLNTNRNPGMSKADVEAALNDALGITTVIWLEEGVVPDPITDGHVDGIAVFVAPGVVMMHTSDDPSAPNYAICASARERLLAATDAAGRALEIIELPLGPNVTHVNFYLPNGGVLVPLEGDAAVDDVALGILRDAFPDREVVGLTGTVMAEGGGGVHCITMQVPLA